MTHSPRTIRDLLDAHGLAPRRDLGQNFVADANTVRRIAGWADVGPDDHVVEIGAGLGSLTLALAETGARVTAIEVDRGVVPVLRDVVSSMDRVRVVEADVTRMDWTAILDAPDRTEQANVPGPLDPTVPTPNDRGAVVVANLPYNIGTPLVCDLLDHVPGVARLVVMVQREVAERFVARPGTKAYGAVSVKVAYWASARILGHVPASVFVPRPNVESSVVEVTRHDPPDVDAEVMFDLVRRGFAHRRKMLRRTLDGVVSPEQFERADVTPTARAEDLDLEDWCRLTRVVSG